VIADQPTSPQRLDAPATSSARGWRLAALSLTALGVVYGDIGTSPLYAFRECFKPTYGLDPTPAAVYGVLSLIAWSLVLIVSVKYLVVIIRLDNNGEGGSMALLAMLPRIRRRGLFIALGLFGAALLYGDGIITPAISVLSATEGLEIAAPGFRLYVLPAALLVLFLLFRFQRYGTARVGGVFGPIMLLWFVAIGVLGALEITRQPAILAALNPWHGARLFWEHRGVSFLVLGGVVLIVTGAEALYADLGHFGRRPIQLAWFTLALPALLLNYFGQGALVLAQPEAIANPFYLLAPRALLYPLVGLATAATTVASQALISGVFSLTQQGMRLRYAPRMTVIHTSRSEFGQIYLPGVNTALMVGCLALVLGFRSSAALAGAYGVAVTGTMAITSVLFFAIAHYRWRWPWWSAGAVTGAFLLVDLAFVGANLGKIAGGGWVPLAVAVGAMVVMTTWHRGTELVTATLAQRSMPLEPFLAMVEDAKPPRVPGTAVFLTPTLEGAPPSLVHHFRYNRVLHEEVILVSIVTEEVPEVPARDRVRSRPLGAGFWRVEAHYGFMERPDVGWVVSRCCEHGMAARPEDTTFYLGRAYWLPGGPAPMWRWRKRLFAFMSWNASSATDFFGVPPDRVLELGARIEF
jgi:KUP system potassium uptake protein